jgi:hypothetical protein
MSNAELPTPRLILLITFAALCALSVIYSIGLAFWAVWPPSREKADVYLRLAGVVGSGPAMLTALVGLGAHAFKKDIQRFLRKQ